MEAEGKEGGWASAVALVSIRRSYLYPMFLPPLIYIRKCTVLTRDEYIYFA